MRRMNLILAGVFLLTGCAQSVKKDPTQAMVRSHEEFDLSIVFPGGNFINEREPTEEELYRIRKQEKEQWISDFIYIQEQHYLADTSTLGRFRWDTTLFKADTLFNKPAECKPGWLLPCS